MVKQLSNAIPTTKRQRQNDQNVEQNVVAMPPISPAILVPIKAGILPYLSAIQPKTNPPSIAPQKKIACAVDGSAEFEHTQFNCKSRIYL